MRSRRGSAVITVVATLAVLGLAALAFIYSGAYNVAATESHTAFGDWVLSTIQHRSVAARAGEVPEPPSVDSAAVDHGFEHFDAMCVTCHGAPGVERGELGQGITPTPPDLAEEAEEYSARELFWMTKHGIKLAGMPAFGPTHTDEEIWGIVAFMQELPEMTEAEYAEWRSRLATPGDSAAGGGHSHAEGTPPHEH